MKGNMKTKQLTTMDLSKPKIKRKIIQISTVFHSEDGILLLHTLCDDGSIFYTGDSGRNWFSVHHIDMILD
jgi:hypothetical protein